MIKPDIKKAAVSLKKCESVLIFAHQGQDGDAFGSMLSIGLALKSMGKHVDYIADKNKNALENIFDEAKNFNKPSLEHYDAALIVDCSTKDYVYGGHYIEKCDKTIIIDHHFTNEHFGDVNSIEPLCSATGELIYTLIKYLSVPISHQMAHALFVAISTDSGNFTYSNTTSYTHKIMVELYELFDDFYITADYLKFNDSDVLDALTIALNHRYIYAEGALCIVEMNYKDGYNDEMFVNSDVIINTLRYIRGIELFVLVRQTSQDSYKISMRSDSSDYDVSEISRQFGGGGHKKAAGFSYTGELERLHEYFKEYIKGV